MFEVAPNGDITPIGVKLGHFDYKENFHAVVEHRHWPHLHRHRTRRHRRGA